MERVMILGSASAVPDVEHENTYLMVETNRRVVLVDCPGSPMTRLEKARIDTNRISEIILTHFHPDHVSGFVPLLMGMWLVGRKQPLKIYGLADTLERARKMLELFDWGQWPNFYPLQFEVVPPEEHAVVLETPDLRIYASPVEHLIPAIGLRFEFAETGRVAAYSSDTEPSQSVRRLAQGADVLIHESTGSSRGHTTPEKAGEIAAQAGVGALYLIHYPPQLIDTDTLVNRARQSFHGPVYAASDFLPIPMD